MKNKNLNLDLRVAVVGGTGQVGYPLTEELLKLGAEVVVVSRRKHNRNKDKLEYLKSHGAELQFCGEYDNVENLTEIFEEIDVVVETTQVSVDNVKNIEMKIVEAAEKAGVKRFIPCEYVLTKLADNSHPDILLSTKLYPDYVYKKLEELLEDNSFVLGS
ncbi:NmrA family NAD(P)-binding protein [Oceanirhabdus seepicola]|uniref:NmrA family NAD(P)-binding protein n=1 Tax=Oceanirhabdus seepicola TaxID=2828781 RepID=A0A9J6P1L7_9CLOT|nr:NmrA family NAD(P)-binding protein [Oceanirhabdus seepicola]MCM1989392.1 NmrA family NAD(P)-binding protein [Oceanirhabdus seepicola]